MKIKKTAAALAAIMLLSSTAAFAKTLEFSIGSPDMYISDAAAIEKKVLDCKPYTSNDRTLVPVRVISENFGAEVGWDDAAQRVDITAGDTKITLHIGSNTAEVNGEKITLDVSPELTDSRTMVPLRFISEALGKRVEYVEPSEQVLISDDGYAISVDDFDISIDDIRFYAATEGLLTDKEQLSKELPELLSEIAGNAALSSEAKKAGITASEDNTVLTDYLLAYKDNLYGIGSLLAPGIKMYTNESHSSAYLEIVNMTPDNEELLNIYNSEYIRVKHILIKSFDSSTAEYYDDDKKAEMKKKAEDILAEIKKGGDFDSLHKEYNEDDESFFYPDGMTIRKDEIIESFADAAFALKEDEISEIVESQYGYHIIKRLPLSELDEKIFKEIESSIVPYLCKINAVKNSNIVYHMTNEEIVDKLIK